jgi:acyl-CoA reductase-like NAD-dependent aldehyde dehydrogenase
MARAEKLGHSLGSTTKMRPLFSRAQQGRSLGWLDIGVAEQARALTSGTGYAGFHQALLREMARENRIHLRAVTAINLPEAEAV